MRYRRTENEKKIFFSRDDFFHGSYNFLFNRNHSNRFDVYRYGRNDNLQTSHGHDLCEYIRNRLTIMHNFGALNIDFEFS